MGRTISSFDCPACGIECWVYVGDLNDMTVPDIEAIGCWHCHHVFSTDEDEAEVGALVEDSFKTPGEALL